MNDGTILVGDFETTVYTGQEKTEVWASALVELWSEDVQVLHSLPETLDYLIQNYKGRVTIYYHNLKFDGSFWLSYIINTLHYEPWYEVESEKPLVVTWKNKWKMKPNTYSYLISQKGQWYTITIRTKYLTITLKDSFKLLPFSVKRIGQAFHTKHKKLEMEYTGYRYAGCEITEKEKHYIANDVLIVKEALEHEFEKGHKKLTIGSCCLSEYKNLFERPIDERTEQFSEATLYASFDDLFPDLRNFKLDKEVYGFEDAEKYCRKAYKGAWCYVREGYEGKVLGKGLTVDVNSLYPSEMHSSSGNYFPIGRPHFWAGNYIPNEALTDNRYYILRVRTCFELKQGYLPTVQIKDTYFYPKNKWLTTSDYFFEPNNKYYKTYIDRDGQEVKQIPVMTMTMTDWKLFNEHYNLSDTEILSGCWFDTTIGLFDEYIDKYKFIKMNSVGAEREDAKLFLNNLYGKFASSDDSSFKVVKTKEDGTIYFDTVTEHQKAVVYVPVGAAITSYARNFTIRSAQANFKYFRYADTDSIHCECDIKDLKGIKIHPTEFECWKVEGQWDMAKFVRQKTYIEHIIGKDEKLCKPFYEVKCAGMTAKCKELFNLSIEPHKTIKVGGREYQVTLDFKAIKPDGSPQYTEEEQLFLSKRRTIDDFKLGLRIPSRLYSKQISGGVLIYEDYMEIRALKY